MTSLEKDGIVIVSVDGVREAGSTDTWRTSPSGQALVEAFRVKSGKNLQWESATDDTLASTVNSQGTSDIPADIQQRQRNEMKDALYGLGNLRKKNTGGEE